ncbi:MAG: glycoside hydrolase family 44 protein [Armatimonadaceae bacterium]
MSNLRSAASTLVMAAVSLLTVGSAVRAQNAAVTIQVDAATNRRPINPLIYGTAYGNKTTLSDLNVPLNRNGGNNTSRYNWQQNADNRGSDWYFQSIGDASATPGERGDRIVADSRSGGAEPMLTIPMVGYVAKLGANRSKLASFSIAKYGPQTGSDWQWFPDAGNGISSLTGQFITGNNPLDANVAADENFQRGWVQHLVGRWGTAGSGGVKYFILDNEPSLWHGTHRDVHPSGATMDEVLNKIKDYGTMIRSVDPTCLLIGPEEWGWTGYFLSGYDQQWASKNGWNWSQMPDRKARGGWDYMPYLLDQLRQHQQATGQRLLDVFTLHFYPQGGEFSNDVSTTMQLRRNRSTRALWDPNYRDETWISDYVKLIPRMKGWVDQYYPGTKIGITEYNWGAENHINGATTQADIWGIFGREGLDMACRWVTPDAATPTYKAMKMYRNYDGNKSAFGDVSVACAAPNPDTLSAFAAQRTSDGALTVMVISKALSGNTPVTLNLANYSAGSAAQIWQLTSANTISRLSDVAVSGGAVKLTVPAQSVTLVVLAKGTTPPPPPSPANPTFSSRATATPATFTQGGTTTLAVTVTCSTGSLTNGIVDLEVYNASGQKVFQKYQSGQSFATGQSRAYSWTWTPTAAGTYSVKVGVFAGSWSPNYHWNGNAATVTVNPPAANPTFTSSATFSPSSPRRNSAVTLTVPVRCQSGALSGGLVNVEVYNAAGQKVFQKFASGQNFATGQTIRYSWSWTPTVAGTYTVKVGVFSGTWAILYHWNNGAATIPVGN